MSLPDPTSPRFLKIGTELVRLTCLSRVYHWLAHYDHIRRLPVRCAGVNCIYCSAGRVPELRFVLGCISARHGRCLIELRERHRGVLEEMDSHPCQGVGYRIDCWKTGIASNAPIEFKLGAWEAEQEWDISRLVDSLGASAHSEAPDDRGAILDNASARLLENTKTITLQ